ncbi:MAG: hypothetical protein RR450_08750 [Oscillospiraceae bacterium]
MTENNKYETPTNILTDEELDQASGGLLITSKPQELDAAEQEKKNAEREKQRQEGQFKQYF